MNPVTLGREGCQHIHRPHHCYRRHHYQYRHPSVHVNTSREHFHVFAYQVLLFVEQRFLRTSVLVWQQQFLVADLTEILRRSGNTECSGRVYRQARGFSRRTEFQPCQGVSTCFHFCLKCSRHCLLVECLYRILFLFIARWTEICDLQGRLTGDNSTVDQNCFCFSNIRFPHPCCRL